MGRSFWEMLGDDQTYEELLRISEEVGASVGQFIPRMRP
jgi:hypothetical protein